MAEDIVDGTGNSHVVREDPNEVTEAALTPASSVLSLQDRLKQARAQRGDGPVRQEVVGERRRPGRPQGSKNKPKDEPEAEKPSAKELKSRSEELAKQILDKNEELMRFIMDRGIPPTMLYKPGRIPAVSQDTGIYTELGFKLSIKAGQASTVASFLAELEATNVGKTMSGVTAGTPLALIVKGLLAGYAIYTYSMGVREVLENLQRIQEAALQYEASSRQADREQSTVGGLQ